MSLPDGRKVIAFDFDGVLHEYHGWNHGILGAPMPGMQETVEALIAEGAHVVVHTTRSKDVVGPWLRDWGFPALDVYTEKWSRIDVFVDDRAFNFQPWQSQPKDRGMFVQALMTFQPHWRA